MDGNAGAKMAAVDVSKELEEIKLQLKFHDQLHKDNTETLKQVKDVLVKMEGVSSNVANMVSRLNRLDEYYQKELDKLEADTKERFGKLDDKHEKIDDAINENRTTIVRWSGGLAVVVSVIGLLPLLLKLVN